MGRIRTIKPDFWKHEDLSELPEYTHMLAAALLNYADDEGYFNANPRLVQAECLPLRECSVSIQGALKQLVEVGYLEVGEAENGKQYGRITSFSEHQRVNRPTPSKIKALSITWGDSLSAHTQLSESSPPEGKGKEGKGIIDTNVSLSPSDDAKPIDQISEAVNSYNLAAEQSGWPKVQALSQARRSALSARLRECGGLDGWDAALAKAQASNHCCGQNERGWTANFDFLTKQSSFTKLMEGNYDNRQGSGPNSANDAIARAARARRA